MPVVGFLFSSTSKAVGPYIAPLTAGSAQTGYVEGRNIAFEYRMAEDHYERLPALANDLVRRRVAVIFTAGNAPPALAAKAATQAVPIVFMIGADPVRSGLVGSLARPGGNITGVTSLAGELTLKRLALLHELVPAATITALLYDPAGTEVATEAAWKNLQGLHTRLSNVVLVCQHIAVSRSTSEQRLGLFAGRSQEAIQATL
jgi:putative tryptophan/tyrosine transport system substrate-binding protein